MTGVTVARWKAEVLAGALLAGIGGFFLYFGWRLPPPDEPGVPGPGTVPMLLGAIIVLCGISTALPGFLKADRDHLDLGGAKQGIALAGLILATALFEPAGFMLSTFVFLSSGFILLGGADWKRALPAAALVSGGLWIVFTKLLGVGLPYGVIAEILFR